MVVPPRGAAAGAAARRSHLQRGAGPADAGDRRARPRRAAAGDARRQRADDGPLAALGRLRAALLGDRLVLADRRLPGGDPARRQPRHAGLPLVGEGAGAGDRHQPPTRRRRDRAPPLRRQRPAARRRRQPREHPQRRRAALDADDEHRAQPPPAARPRLQRLLRPPLRGRPHDRPRPRRHRPRAPRRPRPGPRRRPPADRTPALLCPDAPITRGSSGPMRSPSSTTSTARSPASRGPARRRRGPTGWSSSPTTASPRGKRSATASATRSRTWCGRAATRGASSPR
jgi:hypothetical protein